MSCSNYYLWSIITKSHVMYQVVQTMLCRSVAAKKTSI